MDFNFLTGRENNFLTLYESYQVHREMIESFKSLQKKAKDEINADLQIISSFRDYERQKIIWNLKAGGQRKIFDDEANEIDITKLSELEIFKAIMRFSAMPGASRHHWGTDIDIFDQNNLARKDVQLTYQECCEGAPLYSLHKWLDKIIARDESFGFYRPYQTDRGGIANEPWHLSFKPVSEELYNLYTIDVFEKNIVESDFLLKDHIIKNLENIYQTYILNIDL